jgi:TonB family protein
MRRALLAIGSIAILLLSLGVPICAQLPPLHPRDDSPAQETEPGVYRVGHAVKPPRLTNNRDPEYSDQARKLGYEGTCVLTLVVDAEGMPQKIKMTRPLGIGLDDEAIKAVRQWRFTPATKDGAPVAVQINVEVSFNLYSKGGKDQGLFQKANAGDAKAQFEVSQILLSDPALAQDDSRGFAYLEKAAKQNFSPAQFEMGEYFSSRKNDLVTAYVWYALARKNRYKQSDKKLKDLAEKMSPEQLAEARQRAESNTPF